MTLKSGVKLGVTTLKADATAKVACVFWNSQINGRAPVMELLLGKVKVKIFAF